jgi:hypothetical protein
VKQNKTKKSKNGEKSPGVAPKIGCLSHLVLFDLLFAVFVAFNETMSRREHRAMASNHELLRQRNERFQLFREAQMARRGKLGVERFKFERWEERKVVRLGSRVAAGLIDIWKALKELENTWKHLKQIRGT